MKKNILLLLCIFLPLWGCEEGDSAAKELAKVELSIDENLYLSDEGDTQTFTVTANKAWAIKGADELDWLVLEPSAGGAGDNTVTVRVNPNETYSPREAELTLSCGSEEKSFKLVQVQNDALILSDPSFEMTSDGGEFELVVKSNIDFTVEIPEDSKQWITQEENETNTRALQSHILTFKVAEYNGTQKERQGSVIIKTTDGDKFQVIDVIQDALSAQLPTLLVETAGTLKQSLAALTDKTDTITMLNIVGSIDSQDIDYVNTELGAKLISLRMNRADMAVSQETCKVRFPEKALSKCKLLVSFTFPRNIEVIGEAALMSRNKLNCELEIPETVTVIEGNAFYNATFRGKLTLPSGLVSIGASAFSGCSLLTGDLNLPAGVNELPDRVFYGCSGLSGQLVLPETLQTLGNWVFYGCTGFSDELVIPATLTQIGTYTFGNCSGLSSVKFAGELEEIPASLFYGCKKLAGELQLPPALKKIGNMAFGACSQLTTIRFPESLTSIDASAFTDCIGLVGTLTLPKNLTELGGNAFQGCTGITEMIFPEVLTSIGGFAKCTGLQTLKVPDSVTELQADAFKGCSNLKTVTLSKNLKKIGRMAFNQCFALEGNLDIPASVESIEDYAFKECALTGVTFHEGLQSVGSCAFQQCSGITKLELPSSLTQISSDAFKGIGITELNIPATVKSLTGFSSCLGLKKVVVPATVTEIADGAFYQCKNLTEIVFEGPITRIGNNAFSSCGFTSFECPESVTELGDNVFNGTPLTSVKFPSGITSLPKGALSGCKLTFFEIPATVESVGESFLTSSKELETVIVSEKITELPKQMFYQCTKLKTIVIKGKITKMGAQCLQRCEALETFSVPEGVTLLENNTFWGDNALRNLTLPESLVTINDFVFRDMKGLPELTIPKNVVKMGNQLFTGSTEMKKLTVLAETPPVITSTTFQKAAEDLVIYVPAASLNAYKTANFWSAMTIEAIK